MAYRRAVLLGLLLTVGVFVSMLLFLELGRRISRWRSARDPQGARAAVGVMDGAVFALLGLLIAFTFSGAASRWDARRQLVVEEANAIGTAYLRLAVLPPAAQPALREKFRQYVDARLAAYRALPDVSAAQAELARTATLQGEIWAQAVAASRSEGFQSTRILVLPALNAMIDITTTRTVAVQAHPPSIIYVMLIVLMLVSSLLAGHGLAEGQGRNWGSHGGLRGHHDDRPVRQPRARVSPPRLHPSRRLRPATGRREGKYEVTHRRCGLAPRRG
jgi:hypothetical protein